MNWRGTIIRGGECIRLTRTAADSGSSRDSKIRRAVHRRRTVPTQADIVPAEILRHPLRPFRQHLKRVPVRKLHYPNDLLDVIIGNAVLK